MPFRYRRRVRLAKGVYLNVGKRGINSVTLGKRGASVNVNKHGERENIGIPGSGLSYQTKRKAGCLGCGSVLAVLTLGAIMAAARVAHR